PLSFFFSLYRHHRHLHSFPTRRSSDLCDLRTTVLGTSLSMPLILAPVGSSRLFYPRGEEVAARVAGAAGIAYTLSTLSGCGLERSEEHTSELQSRGHLVCRLLLEKKNR